MGRASKERIAPPTPHPTHPHTRTRKNPPQKTTTHQACPASFPLSPPPPTHTHPPPHPHTHTHVHCAIIEGSRLVGATGSSGRGAAGSSGEAAGRHLRLLQTHDVWPELVYLLHDQLAAEGPLQRPRRAVRVHGLRTRRAQRTHAHKHTVQRNKRPTRAHSHAVPAHRDEHTTHCTRGHTPTAHSHTHSHGHKNEHTHTHTQHAWCEGGRGERYLRGVNLRQDVEGHDAKGEGVGPVPAPHATGGRGRLPTAHTHPQPNTHPPRACAGPQPCMRPQKKHARGNTPPQPAHKHSTGLQFPGARTRRRTQEVHRRATRRQPTGGLAATHQ
jgi:hypothetical protein